MQGSSTKVDRQAMPYVLATVIALYFAAGSVFALAFVARGAGVIDPAAQTASLATRVLWLPAAIGLWPMLLRRWLVARKERATP